MGIITFSTSNSTQSISRDLIEYITNLTKDAEMIDLREFDSAIYSPDLEKESGVPAGIKALNQKLEQSRAVIISLNEHNGYPPAFFKNLIDWLSREKRQFLAEKSIILISSSTGKMGGKSSLDAMSKTLPIFGAKVVASISIGKFFEVFKDGELVDLAIKKQLTDAIESMDALKS